MAEAGRASPSPPRNVMPDASNTSSTTFVCSERSHVWRGGGCAGRGAALALADDASKASSAFDATRGNAGCCGPEEGCPSQTPLVGAGGLRPPSLAGADTAEDAAWWVLGSEQRASHWTAAGAATPRTRSGAEEGRPPQAPLVGAAGLLPPPLAGADTAAAAWRMLGSEQCALRRSGMHVARCGSNERPHASARVPGGAPRDAIATAWAQKTVLSQSGHRLCVKKQVLSSALLCNRPAVTETRRARTSGAEEGRPPRALLAGAAGLRPPPLAGADTAEEAAWRMLSSEQRASSRRGWTVPGAETRRARRQKRRPSSAEASADLFAGAKAKRRHLQGSAVTLVVKKPDHYVTRHHAEPCNTCFTAAPAGLGNGIREAGVAGLRDLLHARARCPRRRRRRAARPGGGEDRRLQHCRDVGDQDRGRR